MGTLGADDDLVVASESDMYDELRSATVGQYGVPIDARAGRNKLTTSVNTAALLQLGHASGKQASELRRRVHACRRRAGISASLVAVAAQSVASGDRGRQARDGGSTAHGRTAAS